MINSFIRKKYNKYFLFHFFLNFKQLNFLQFKQKTKKKNEKKKFLNYDEAKKDIIDLKQ